MQTHTLAIKDPNYASVVPCNIKAAIPRIDAITWTMNFYEDDRKLTSNNHIHERKPAFIKNRKRTMDYNLIAVSHDN